MMSSATSRLSQYNSSTESDGEFCEGSSAARDARLNHLATIVGSSNTLSSTGIVHGDAGATGQVLARSNSNPSLASEEIEKKGRTLPNGIPDYNVPPPYAATSKQVLVPWRSLKIPRD